MAKNSINNRENNLTKKPLNDLYTGNLLDTLKTGEHVSLEGDHGNFVFYKNDENEFGVHHNSAGINFVNNPMSKNEMESVLKPIISHADNLEGKISHDLLNRLKNIFWEKTEKNKNEILTVDDLLKSISLENILTGLDFNKQLLSESEHKISQGIIGYLENATNILNELVSQYPEKSVIRNKVQEKLNYLESYKKTFSDGKFIEGIKNNISDLNNLLDILENQDPKGELAYQIKDLRNKKAQNDFSGEIELFFNKIYAWDAFAITYAQFGDPYGIAWSVDHGSQALAQVYGWDKGSEEINRLGKKQEPLMSENLSFEEKKKAFEDANKEYWNSIGLILGTGHNSLPSNKEYYEDTKKHINLEDFVSMPCSDIYPAVFQITILPFYLRDLYQEACDILGTKSLDKTINQYMNELKNPSGLAKFAATFKNNDKKIESLIKISDKIKLLKNKFDNLYNNIKSFGDKRHEDLVKIASEFCVIEDFMKLNNTQIYPTFNISDQDKRLNFMRKN